MRLLVETFLIKIVSFIKKIPQIIAEYIRSVVIAICIYIVNAKLCIYNKLQFASKLFL